MGSASQDWYEDERKTYSEAYKIRVSNEDALFVLRKLCVKYGTIKPDGSLPFRVEFRTMGGGTWYQWKRKMNLRHHPSVGLIIHEFSHYLHDNKPTEIRTMLSKMAPNKGTSHHGTHFSAVLHRVHDYGKGRTYWKPLIEKRIESRKLKAEKKQKQIEEKKLKPKPEPKKPEPMDKGLQKIKESEQKIEDWEKKLIEIEKSYLRRTKMFEKKIRKERTRVKGMKKYRGIED